jgi:hypothetical protein
VIVGAAFSRQGPKFWGHQLQVGNQSNSTGMSVAEQQKNRDIQAAFWKNKRHHLLRDNKNLAYQTVALSASLLYHASSLR